MMSLIFCKKVRIMAISIDFINISTNCLSKKLKLKRDEIFRMNMHVFGAISSPACATYGIRYLADPSTA